MDPWTAGNGRAAGRGKRQASLGDRRGLRNRGERTRRSFVVCDLPRFPTSTWYVFSGTLLSTTLTTLQRIFPAFPNFSQSSLGVLTQKRQASQAREPAPKERVGGTEFQGCAGIGTQGKMHSEDPSKLIKTRHANPFPFRRMSRGEGITS